MARADRGLSTECFRVTLWIDPEPMMMSNTPIATFETSDLANAVKLNLSSLDPAQSTAMISVGDLIEVLPIESILEPLHSPPPGFIFTVRHHTLVRQQGLQLSIPIGIAKTFDLEKHNRAEVVLRKVPNPIPPNYCADHVELFFKDQYMGRGEMWRMTMMMFDSPAWVGREVTLGGLKVKAKVGRVYIKGKRITPHTKFIFRSESAKYHLFIQISSEMWTFEEDGSLYHEKAILFLEDLFARWSKVGTNHLLSLVLFARVFYEDHQKVDIPPPILTLPDGRAYKDFYKVIVDLEPVIRPQKVLDDVREEIFNFQKHALTYIDKHNRQRLAGSLSLAPEGNILEAMGIACNSFDEHYVDRDLRRTGVSIVFVTAGTCVYHVDQMLLRLTTERFITHGIGVDFVSLAKIPLHVVPLFRFLAPEPDSTAPSSRAIDPSFNPIYIDPVSPQSTRSIHYSVPFFVDCSFFSRHQDRPFRIDRFMPRCRMPQIQNGIGEHDLTGISIPLLSRTMPPVGANDDLQSRKKARQKFDAEVVGATPFYPATRQTKKLLKGSTGSRSAVDTLAATAVEPKRQVSNAKHDNLNRSPLLKPTIPQGATDISLLANHPSASLSIIPVSGSGATRDRAASASTTGSGSTNIRTTALIARLTGLSQQQPRSFWLWPAQATPKAEASLPPSTSNRTVTPPETPAPRRDDVSSTHTPSRDSSVAPTMGRETAKTEGVRQARSEMMRSATALMPLINAPRRNVSSSSTHLDISPADLSQDPIPKKAKPRFLVRKFNPSNPSGTSSGLLSQFRRWSAIFPRSQNDQRSLKWKSLTTPACLPITTDFCPKQEELDEMYMVIEYELPICDSSLLVKRSDASFSREESNRLRAAETLREAISQRLCQCFQLVMPEHSTYDVELPSSRRPFGDSLIGIIKQAEQGAGAYVDLSLSDHYHRLSIRKLDSGKPHLHIQIYTRYRNWHIEPYVYRPAIWILAESSGWQEFELKFNFVHLDSFDFKKLDRIIVGLDSIIPLSEDLRYWRTRAVFLPAIGTSGTEDSMGHAQRKKRITEDENRLAGMLKLQTSLRNVNWQTTSDSAILGGGSALDLTTVDASQHVRHESARLSAVATSYRDQREKTGKILSLRDPLNVIVEALLNPTWGIEIRTQLIQLRLVENVFQGDRLVSFLKHQFDFQTREEALTFGRQLELRGMFKEVTSGIQPRPLVDEGRYYQLSSEYFPAKTTRTWFGKSTNDKSGERTQSGSNLIRPISSSTNLPNLEEKNRSNSMSRSLAEKPIVMMTRVGIIDLDPTGKSDRSEKAIIHCDRSHSPSNAWHVEIQWLGITSVLIDGLLQQWSRIVERFDIKIVEQNVRSLENLSIYSPLQRTITIPLALKPPPLEELEEFVPITTSANYYLEAQLVKSHGFVLDVEADRNFPSDVNVVYSYRRESFEYSQFIHSTGVSIVQIRDGSFVWAENLAARIDSSHRYIGAGSDVVGVDPKQLRKSFIDFCQDEHRLRAFWDDCLNRLREFKEGDKKSS